MKRCYYEVLEVDKKATNNEIKSVITILCLELQKACT
jgi:DnaJ-class molecular chaperone